jgi:hypothetical protein
MILELVEFNYIVVGSEFSWSRGLSIPIFSTSCPIQIIRSYINLLSIVMYICILFMTHFDSF